jgi:hypothetical protein
LPVDERKSFAFPTGSKKLFSRLRRLFTIATGIGTAA